MNWAMDALGLSVDADARAVKRAYAARLKTTRPDDDPAAFQQLHATYQAALAWCADRASASVATDAAPADCAPTLRDEALPGKQVASTPLRAPPHAHGRTPLAESIHDPALEAELRGWQHDFDPGTRAARIVDAARRMDAAAFSAWLGELPELWSLEARPLIGDAVLGRLAAQTPALGHDTVEPLVQAFGWDRDGSGIDQGWLRSLRQAMRIRAALQPDGDGAVLAYHLEQAGWNAMTPQWAERLRARLMRPYTPWRSFAAALVPMRPGEMAHLSAIVRRWFPDAMPAAFQHGQLRFWTQIGTARRPHLRQLTLALARGILVAAVLALPFTVIARAGWSMPPAWSLQAIGVSLGAWVALALLQLSARWQARPEIASARKRALQQCTLPLACIAAGVLLRDAGAWVHAAGTALVYLALARWLGRVRPQVRARLILVLVFAAPAILLPLFAFDSVIPWAIAAALLWTAPVFIDDRASTHH